MSLKNPVTRPGIDPGTFRLVAQRLNHYATPGPYSVKCNCKFKDEWKEWKLTFKKLKIYCKRCWQNGYFMLRSRWIPTVLWMSKQLTKYNLNIRVTTNNCVRKSAVYRENFQGVERLSKERRTDRYTRCHELCVWKAQLDIFFKHCAIQFFQSFMVYTAVYQQQETGHGVHLAFPLIGTVSLSWWRVGWWVALAIHQPLAPKLKKE
jgi:hypothetical protein